MAHDYQPQVPKSRLARLRMLRTDHVFSALTSHAFSSSTSKCLLTESSAHVPPGFKASLILSQSRLLSKRDLDIFLTSGTTYDQVLGMDHSSLRFFCLCEVRIYSSAKQDPKQMTFMIDTCQKLPKLAILTESYLSTFVAKAPPGLGPDWLLLVPRFALQYNATLSYVLVL